VELTEEELADTGYDPEYNDDESRGVFISEAKWKKVRKVRMHAVPFVEVDYTPKAGKRLVDRYRDSGLQIIVKLASIELTPEKPHFPVGGWHVEGQMNESICATALYYLDSENITDNSLSFRMQTSAYMNDDNGYDVGQDAYHWLEAVYGTSLGGSNSPCLQNYGNVQTRQGRLLAFPNVFQHRVSPFKLVDPTKPGHRRFVALWLVDPTKRIISTANIPPQQMTWYVDALLGSSVKARGEALSKLPPELVDLLAEKGATSVTMNINGRLPVELMDAVRGYFDEDKLQLPMSVEEANDHRANLMRERSAFVKTTEEGWAQATYNFCEH
jgi:hypothetical protein